MRVLLANEQSAVVGGMETYLKWLARELCSRGHQVVCVNRYPARSLETWTPAEATAIVASSVADLLAAASGSVVALASPLGDIEFEQALVNVLPTLLFAHTFYGTCVSGAKMHAFPRKEPCGRRLSVACLCLYGPRRCGGTNPLTTLRLYRRESHRARLLLRFKKIIVASQFMAQEFARQGVLRDRIHCVPLPVDQSVSRPAVGFRRRVLFLGRMTAVKGVELLVDAISRISRSGSPVELDLAGDGPMRHRIEARAQRLRVSARFHGWVGEPQRTALFQQSGVLAMPSTWPEPFGLVGLEAAAHGVPAVAFDLGGVREWLIPGVTGEIASASPPTVEGLGAALERALDPSRWPDLSAGAYANSARFLPSVHADAIEQCLRDSALRC